jgi:phosphoribosylformylglycinamidine cyclo-ligase
MYDPTKPYNKEILELIKQTWETPYITVNIDVYPILDEKISEFEVDHTDGVGTKGYFHWKKRAFKNAVIDALAMNLNDLVMMRAIPYKLQNHISLPVEDRTAIIEIVRHLVGECKKRNIAVTGGETSIHPTLKGLDLTMTVSGFVEIRKQDTFKPGDLLIGIKSSGLHSSGFTKLMELYGEHIPDEWLAPSHIYSDTILDLFEEHGLDVHGMVNIAGGAFTKIKTLIKDVNIIIRRNHELRPQKMFYDIYSKGVSDEDMYKIFNNGIGFIISVKPEKAQEIMSQINEFETDIIGGVTAGTGDVKIESMFSEKIIDY